jgi:serine/threonine-protein kinase RsbW
MTMITLRPAAWQRHCIRTLAEMPDLLRRILDELEVLGYVEKDRFAVRLALEEALVNAIKHGNRCDDSKNVRVRYQAGMDKFFVEIEDEGPGFQREELPDPLDPENMERPCGRGVLLMEHYMNSVHFNPAGNCVRMCKVRS